MTDSAATDQGEIIILQQQPLVAETPLMRQTAGLTANARFFIRNHFSIPEIDARSWNLTIGGAVDRPGAVNLDDLQRLPRRTLDTTMECAGNARSFLPPPTDGNPFGYGAVSAARWGGVALADLLREFGLRSSTRELLFVGTDHGFEKNVAADIHFERGLPVEIALHPDTLLVDEMNGEPLPAAHGYPARLIVPGWYGVASVKWLAEIRALEQPFSGYFQTERYVIPHENAPATPLTERNARAVLTSPLSGAVVPDQPTDLRGLAWSGSQPVEAVEISADGGATWSAATVDPGTSPYVWRYWRLTWTPPGPGSYTLQVRATDAAGRVQPIQGEWNFLGYANNGIQNVPIEVRAT